MQYSDPPTTTSKLQLQKDHHPDCLKSSRREVLQVRIEIKSQVETGGRSGHVEQVGPQPCVSSKNWEGCLGCRASPRG